MAYVSIKSMLDVHQKRKLRSVLYNRVTLGALFILALFFMHSTWVVYQKKKTSEELKNLSLQQMHELESRDKELEEQIAKLNTAAGIEAEIRGKFNVAKPEENMVVVVDSSGGDDSLKPASSPSFWRKIYNFFKN
jgi:cell division protein FtsB